MTDDRSKLYKNTLKVPEEMRRRREEEGVVLRKQKRDEQLNKRRQVDPQSDELLTQNHGEVNSDISSELLQYLYSGVPEFQLQATELLRKYLSKEPNPPIEEIIEAGVIPQFVQFLSHSENIALQFEAAWALTNIASGTSSQTQHVVQAGAVDPFIKLLGTQSLQVCEQAVWALGNIAGDNPAYRDMVISKSIIKPLCAILASPQSNTSIVRNTVWCISNLCRGKNPPPDFSQVRETLGFLPQLLYQKDVDTLADTCWSLSYLADGPNSHIQKVIDTGVCRRLVELLAHPETKIVSAALRAVGNIVTGDNRQTQAIINGAALPLLLQLLSHVKESIRKESCWTISNITAGSRSQIQAVIDCNIVPSLVEVLSKAEFKTRKEAAWAITNATSGGNKDQIRYIINQDCIEPLCNLLTVVDPKIISVALSGLENILKLGKIEAETLGHNPYAVMVEECFGLDKLEYLQQHTNVDIYKKAYALIDTYFCPASDEDVNLVPDSQESGFTFNNAITEDTNQPSYSF